MQLRWQIHCQGNKLRFIFLKRFSIHTTRWSVVVVVSIDLAVALLLAVELEQITLSLQTDEGRVVRRNESLLTHRCQARRVAKLVLIN